MTSGGQCVMTAGIQRMLLLSANNWDMRTLEVSLVFNNHEVQLPECTLLLDSNPPAGRAFRNAFFGEGTGPVFLDDVQCSSSSNQLLECFSSPILTHNCLHTEDAGVECEGKFTYTFVETLS